MTNVNKVFRMAFSIIMFCTSIWLLIYQTTIFEDTLENVRDSYKDKEIYQQYNSMDLEVVANEELIAFLCNKPMYNIIIDGVEINIKMLTPENIKAINIKEINYQKSYLYNDKGDIEKIVFTGITG